MTATTLGAPSIAADTPNKAPPTMTAEVFLTMKVPNDVAQVFDLIGKIPNQSGQRHACPSREDRASGELWQDCLEVLRE
ncbi:hypothetical protein [Mycolicibacterium septicum]|uniref:hypothetical protein n=1 Tax=Mycolicibacterium septicum TaxID=98668 RepID=UPI001AF44E5D|nr:hypothetical protein [Mycolicibacterium septicum]QRY51831.1 hypothetical protein JVX95_31405 [Mycolicibacterium septicum]